MPKRDGHLIMHLLEGNLKPLVLVFLIMAIIASVFLAVLPASLEVNESTDYTSFYKPVAQSLLQGKGLVDAGGRAALRYPPGYPLILAGVFGIAKGLHLPEKAVLTGFTVFCLGMAAVFIFLIARVFWPPVPALIAAVGFSTYPFLLWLSKQPNVELPFLLFFYGSVWFFMLAMFNKSRQRLFSFIAGLLLGTSMIIRPIAIGLPLVLGGILWIWGWKSGKGRPWILASLFLLGSLIPVAPWEAWAYHQSGKIILLSSGGVPSIVDGLTFGVHDPGYRQGLNVSGDIQAVMHHFEALRPQLGSIGEIVKATLESLKNQPWATTKLFVWKALRSWYGTDSQRYEFMVLLLQVPYLAAFFWASVRLLGKNSKMKLPAGIILVITAYFWTMTILVLPLLRYMVPALGLLFVLLPGVSAKNRFTAPGGHGF